MNDALDAGGLVPIASGKSHDNTISLNQSGAAFWVARLHDGEHVDLPDARFVHLYVARGSVDIQHASLREGDAGRFTDAGPVALTSRGASEVLVWESDYEVNQ